MKFRVFLILLIASISFSTVLNAQNAFDDAVYEDVKKVAQTGYQFLKLGVGTQGPGMGGSAVTHDGDAIAIFWNPAGITTIGRAAVAFSSTNWIADMQAHAVAGVISLGQFGYLGISALTMDHGNIKGTAISNNNMGYDDTGLLEPAEYAIGLTYARRFTDRFGFGITAKYCEQDLIARNSNIIAYDVGTIYNTNWNNIKIGMSIQHFSKEIRYIDEFFELPLTFRIGLSGDVLSLAGLKSTEHQLIFAVEGVNPRDYSERVHVGLEYWYKQLVALRYGNKFNYDEESYSFGAGVKVKGIEIGYAYSMLGIFDPVSRFSIRMTFN